MAKSVIHVDANKSISDALAAQEAAFPNQAWKYGRFSDTLITGPEYGNVGTGGIGNSTARSYIAESGAQQLSINLGTQKLSGDVSALEFGIGLQQTGTDFWQNERDFRIENVQVGNSTAITSHELLYDLLSGNTDVLEDVLALNGTEQFGTSGNEGFLSFGGDDEFTGNGGSDTFVFASTAIGNDVITDFDAGTSTSSDDVIQFSTSVFADWAAVYDAAEQDGDHVVITHSAGNTITLQNVNLANLDVGDFVFV